MDNENENMLLDWNDALEIDEKEYELLPEGDYNFVVTSFERGRHPGSEKIPACNKAIITLKVQTDGGKPAYIRTNLLLYRTQEWKISAFFRSIGQKKKGERLVMDWNSVLGSKGRAHFRPRDYTNREGKECQVNELDRYYDYDPAFFPPEEDDWLSDDGVEELPL